MLNPGSPEGDTVITLNPESPAAGGSFEGLLGTLPRMAEAVNLFTSEENQRVALTALLDLLGVPDEAAESVGAASDTSESPVTPPAEHQAGRSDHGETPPTKPSNGRQRRKAKKSWPRERDIDFRPVGKVSLRDFVAEKLPVTLYEKNLVAVYYMERILEIPSISVGHVLAAYAACSWKPPSDPENSLQQVSSHKDWLDTSDMKAIRTVHVGSTYVEYDMPVKKDK